MNPETVTHPEFELLLAARDGGDAETAAHLAGCTACAARVAGAAALRDELRALPLLPPPPQVRERISARLAARDDRPGLPRWATLAAAAFLLAITWRVVHRLPEAAASAPQAAAAHDELPGLIARSRSLEAALAAQPEPTALSGADAELIFRYEEGIGALDRKLARLPAGDPAAAKLWRLRGELLGGLLDARAPRASDPDLARL